jgi:dTDP-4-dehydrorhamnose reductase
MRILVTGVKGQLGNDVVKELRKREMEYLGTDIGDFNITNAEETEMFIMNYGPNAVIHCSAYTNVDKAEDDAELCWAVNAEGPRNIARVCKILGAKMLYVSTDYVFSGRGEDFYEVNDKTDPLGVYGQTKLGGELAIRETLEKYFIVRTSWVFGENGDNFIRKMLKLAQTRDVINVVRDQVGSPTYTADLAPLLCDMILTEKYGTYHATNEGVCSWADLAETVFLLKGLETKVKRITTEEFVTKAERPKNSRMSKRSLDEAGFGRLPIWEDAIKRYILLI